MAVYYNEFDPKKAAWLRQLIRDGVVAPGDVDERSISDVRPDDLAGYSQCHFFAGIGVWSWALREAGWPDHRPAWTGSCPCQPFSAAGRREALEDERHLFPAWFGLIEARRPLVVFGEQVADGDGLIWLDVVRSSMDAAGYTLGVVDSCAAGFGAPMRSQRLYIVAEAAGARLQVGRVASGLAGRANEQSERFRRTGYSGLASPLQDGCGEGCAAPTPGYEGWQSLAGNSGATCIVGAPHETGLEGHRKHGAEHVSVGRTDEGRYCSSASVARGPVNGFWRDADWVYCRDEKYRPVEPGTFPLAHGAPARVLRIRGYGDAIVGPQAVEFIKAYLAVCGE